MLKIAKTELLKCAKTLKIAKTLKSAKSLAKMR